MIKKTCQNLKILEIGSIGHTPGQVSGEGVFRIRLQAPDWDYWRPGQFLMIRPSSPETRLVWSRALSIGDIRDQTLELYVQNIGRGTAELAALKPGDEALVWGPLGNMFSVEPEVKTLILAGGIGLAPFVGYARQHPKPENLSLVFSHRKPAGLYPLELMAGWMKAGCIEDFHDQAPEDLPRFLELLDQRISALGQGDLILACGPNPFMRTIQSLAAKTGVRAQLSLENRMVCGLGACLGCVTTTDQGYTQVCSHGPVFWSNKIEF